jgi:hypothetical protein
MEPVSYDIEVFPDAFTLWAKKHDGNDWFYFEISFRKNNHRKLCMWMNYLMNQNCEGMIGYNNLGYDYPVLHFILTRDKVTPEEIYAESMRIINTPWNDRFKNRIRQPFVPQIDLFTIKHFDNAAKSTRLKWLEFFMRMKNVEDMPIEVGTMVGTEERLKILSSYNVHDVRATDKFAVEHCQEDFKLRKELTAEYGVDMTNFSDTKIGATIFKIELERAGVDTSGSTPMPEGGIVLANHLLQYVFFESQAFQSVLGQLQNTTIKSTKGELKIETYLNGLDYHIGTGGLHASVKPSTVLSDDEYAIVDVDVASYYPNLAVKNGFYPRHLSPVFIDVYSSLYERRSKYKKGSAINKALKLALNGTYGNSNSKYSIFFDPTFTMSVTLNGQLLLLMLAEQIMKTPSTQIIQANTDGITFKTPRVYMEHIRTICKWWENLTQLELEEVEYSAMYIRDVNNYIAVGVDGKRKLKGSYSYHTEPHQNHSALIVQRIAEEALTSGLPPREAVHNIDYSDPYDFMLGHKTPRNSQSFIGRNKIPAIQRYYMSTVGEPMVKMMPPETHKGKTEWRPFAVNKGFNVADCNDADRFDWSVLDWEWYLLEAEKLTTAIQAKVI